MLTQQKNKLSKISTLIIGIVIIASIPVISSENPEQDKKKETSGITFESCGKSEPEKCEQKKDKAFPDYTKQIK